MKVTKHPELRFERSYRGITTVLEGCELGRLMEAFVESFRREARSGEDAMDALIISVFKAFARVYPDEIISEEELRDLSTACGRKVDLFYRGTTVLLADVIAEATRAQNSNYRRARRRGQRQSAARREVK